MPSHLLTKTGTVHRGKVVQGTLRAACNSRVSGTPTDAPVVCFRCLQGNGGGRITR
jgi:hypothetical protein